MLYSGDIIKIPLIKDLGVAYAKYISLKDIDQDSTYPDLIKVYNYHSLAEIENIEMLNNLNYLIPPIIVLGLSNTLKKAIWNKIGKLPLTKDDWNLPNFKGWKDGPGINKYTAKTWYIYKGLKLSDRVLSNYDEVKNLEDFAAIGTGIIEIRIAMQIILNENKKFRDYFSFEDKSEIIIFKDLTSGELPPDI